MPIAEPQVRYAVPASTQVVPAILTPLLWIIGKVLIDPTRRWIYDGLGFGFSDLSALRAAQSVMSPPGSRKRAPCQPSSGTRTQHIATPPIQHARLLAHGTGYLGLIAGDAPLNLPRYIILYAESKL